MSFYLDEYLRNLLNGIIPLLISVLRYSAALERGMIVAPCVYACVRVRMLCAYTTDIRTVDVYKRGITHSNYARFGRDLAPLFAINFWPYPKQSARGADALQPSWGTERRRL